MKMNLLLLICSILTFACTPEVKPVDNAVPIIETTQQQGVVSDPLKEEKEIETPTGKKTKKVVVVAEAKPIKVPVTSDASGNNESKILKPTPIQTQKPEPQSDKEAKSEIKNTSQPVAPKPEKKVTPMPIASNPVLFFVDTLHDYGFINEGDTIKHSFKFINRGDAPLEILDVQVSCGCMLPSYSFLDIEPGRLGKIDVTFLSKGKLGPQVATIDLLTNAKNPRQTLYLKGVIR